MAETDVDYLIRRVSELEQRVSALEQQRGDASHGRYGFDSGFAVDPNEPSAHVRELVAAGKKLEAIKVYREDTGVGLKEAKERIEAMGG